MSSLGHVERSRSAMGGGLFALAALGWLAAGCDDGSVPLEVDSDGRRVTVVRKSFKKQYVESDGRRVGGAYDAIRGLQHAPNGEVVFAGKSHEKWQVLRDGEPVGQPYGYVGYLSVSPQGSVAFVGREGEKWQVVRDGKPVGQPVDQVTGLAFSPDGRTLAFGVIDGDKAFLVRDGERTPVSYYAASRLRFDPTGKSLTFVGATDEGVVLVRDGEPLTEPYEQIRRWAISPDGQSVAALAKTREQSLVVLRDGVRVGEELTRNEGVSELAFSPDGRKLACAVAEVPGTWTLYVDGVATRTVLQVDLVKDVLWSPDGKSLAGTARRGAEWYVFVKDQVVSDGYERILNLRTDADGRSLAFSGVRGGRAAQVQIPW
jgi:WD40 repeat protein